MVSITSVIRKGENASELKRIENHNYDTTAVELLMEK